VVDNLPEEATALMQHTAVAVFQALELRDYARIDMRLRPDGRVAVIEANPNPWLASRAEFAMAARKAGRTYPQLIGEIAELALARYGA
jgi:D-alanine-D-alanine ligase